MTCKKNEGDVVKKIELVLKTIARTDSYLNSANTKSTILLSLASAVIVAIIANFDKVICLVDVDSDRIFLSLLLIVIVGLLVISLLFSLKGVTPNISKSDKENTFSFVDISSYYSSLDCYSSSFKSVSDLELLEQLIALNYTLSRALTSKYEMQIIAIDFMKMAVYVLCFLIYVVALSNW